MKNPERPDAARLLANKRRTDEARRKDAILRKQIRNHNAMHAVANAPK